ncbi:MAG: hypothetical protein ABEI97_04580, partial [Candidatus Nanohaloarchaea archaeon]
GLSERPPHTPQRDSGDARVDARDVMLEQSEDELPVERDIMHELHKEAEAFRDRLLRQYPAAYVDRLFAELAEVPR